MIRKYICYLGEYHALCSVTSFCFNVSPFYSSKEGSMPFYSFTFHFLSHCNTLLTFCIFQVYTTYLTVTHGSQIMLFWLLATVQTADKTSGW